MIFLVATWRSCFFCPSVVLFAPIQAHPEIVIAYRNPRIPARPCAPCCLACAKWARSMPPSAKTGSLAASAQVPNCSQPKGVASGWLGVGKTGDSTMKSTPTCSAWRMSSGLWQDAATHNPKGNGLCRRASKRLPLRCTPAAPVCNASPGSALISRPKPRGRHQSTARRANAIQATSSAALTRHCAKVCPAWHSRSSVANKASSSPSPPSTMG